MVFRIGSRKRNIGQREDIVCGKRALDGGLGGKCDEFEAADKDACGLYWRRTYGERKNSFDKFARNEI